MFRTACKEKDPFMRFQHISTGEKVQICFGLPQGTAQILRIQTRSNIGRNQVQRNVSRHAKHDQLVSDGVSNCIFS